MESSPPSPIKSEELLKVTLLIELLAKQDEKDLTALMNAAGPEYARLLIAIGALVDKAAGNLNKLFELVTALELKAEEGYKEIVHVKHEYGADLLVTDNETGEQQGFEIKNSVVKVLKSYRSNWLFNVNDNLISRYRVEKRNDDLKLLIGSIYEKQKNGVTCFVARSGTERLNCYKISGAFVALYSVKKLIDLKSSSVNFGSERCFRCKQYHRMQHLQVYAMVLDGYIKESGKPFEYRLDYFNDIQWDTVLKSIESSTGCV